MSTNRPANHWWRRVPSSTPVGVLSLVASVLLLASSVLALVTHAATSPFAFGLEITVGVLAALNLLRAVTGLAAFRP